MYDRSCGEYPSANVSQKPHGRGAIEEEGVASASILLIRQNTTHKALSDGNALDDGTAAAIKQLGHYKSCQDKGASC